MPVKMRLPRKPQIARTKRCHIKLFPDKYLGKFDKFGCFNVEKFMNVQSQRKKLYAPPLPLPSPPLPGPIGLLIICKFETDTTDSYLELILMLSTSADQSDSMSASLQVYCMR